MFCKRQRSLLCTIHCLEETRIQMLILEWIELHSVFLAEQIVEFPAEKFALLSPLFLVSAMQNC